MKLIDSVIANTDGAWFHISEINGGQTPKSVQVEGITTATVTMEVANGDTNPPAGEKEVLSVTADDLLDISSRYDWYRGRVTGYTSGTITITIT